MDQFHYKVLFIFPVYSHNSQQSRLKSILLQRSRFIDYHDTIWNSVSFCVLFDVCNVTQYSAQTGASRVCAGGDHLTSYRGSVLT